MPFGSTFIDAGLEAFGQGPYLSAGGVVDRFLYLGSKEFNFFTLIGLAKIQVGLGVSVLRGSERKVLSPGAA